MTKAATKLCHGHMNAHLYCHHLEIKMEQSKRPAAASKQNLDGTLNKLPSSSEKGKTNQSVNYPFYLQRPPPV